MANRLFPTEVFRGHWKALSDYRGDKPRPDWLTRIAIAVLPVTAGLVFWIGDVKLAAPGAVLSGVALLAGGFLGAFGQMSGLRAKLTEREYDYVDAERSDRDALDETVAHLLVAAYLAGMTALVLVLGMNFGLDAHGALGGLWGAAAIALATYVLLVFVIVIPRLYNSYAYVNRVRPELSGTHRGR